MGFIKWLVNAQKDYNQRQNEVAKDERELRNELDKQGVVYCPKCLSTQISANNKNFSVKKALIGDILVGPVGLVAGAIGNKKVMITCLKCGYKWEAGKK